MAITVFKTFAAGEVLTAADLNSSLSKIVDNGEDLGWPATKAKDLNGQSLILDSDGDTSITVDTDDRIDFSCANFDVVRMNTVASAVNGIDITSSATGNGVIIAAYGSDTDIDVSINAKGSGTVSFGGGALAVGAGGTGATSLTDGGVLLGSGAGAITPMAVLANGAMIVGDGTTDPVAESGATLRTSIGVVIGTDVQAQDANLDQIAALAVTNSNFIVGNGSAWVAESGATVRASLGLGTLAELNSVTASQIDSNAVAQAELKTTTSEVSTSSTSPANLILGGGEFGFYPRLKSSGSGEDINASIAATTIGVPGTSYLTRIQLTSPNANTAFARHTYVQASPPYDLGDGEIPLFVFATIVNATGEIESMYSAPEAPWHYNGPTRIAAHFYDENGNGYQYRKIIPASIEALRANPNFNTDPKLRRDFNQAIRELPTEDVLIDQDLKNADMPLIPHPFLGNDLTGRTVVMFDPVASEMVDLKEFLDEDEGIQEIVSKYFNLGNSELVRVGPPGVMVVSAKWK